MEGPARLRHRAAGAAAPTCEAEIKAETQATLRNIPFDTRVAEGRAEAPGAGAAATGTCIKCGRPSSGEAWFAKAY